MVNRKNEIIKKYINERCEITVGTLGTEIKGKIIDVSENWIEIEVKKGKEIVNAEFIQNIKIYS